MSIILGGKKMEIPGVQTVSWLDASSPVKRAAHSSDRSTFIRGIVLHTIHGKLGTLKPGFDPVDPEALANARYQANTDRAVSWDYTISQMGIVLVSNDPLERYSWQAEVVNGYTLGIEFSQDDNGDLYEGQLQAGVQFLDFLTAKLGIQRQIPFVDGHWDQRLIKRLASKDDGGTGEKGSDLIGLYAHHNQTNNRGIGDCGPHIFNMLKQAGYECFDFAAKQDKAVWKQRQLTLGFSDKEADGVPGPKTREALKTAGYKHGMYVHRPIDDLMVVE